LTPALHLIMAEKLELAIALFKLNNIAFPDFTYSFYYLAQAYLRQGDRDSARECTKKIFASDPNNQAAIHLMKMIETATTVKPE